MDLIIRSSNRISSWPAFVDAMVALVLVIVFSIMAYFLSDIDRIRDLHVRSRQEQVEQAITKEFRKEIEEESVRIVCDGNLQRISFSNNLLFDLARKELLPGGREILTRLRSVLIDQLGDNQNIVQKVEIEAHADPRPLPVDKTPFASNWDLSVARAAEVVKLMIGDSEEVARMKKYHGEAVVLDPSLFAATGCSLFQPPVEVEEKAGRHYFRGWALPDTEFDRYYMLARRMNVLLTYSRELPE